MNSLNIVGGDGEEVLASVASASVEELHHAEAMTRVIHLLNSQGKTVAIGWEPACSVVDRVKAASQANHLMERVSALLATIQFLRIPPMTDEKREGYRAGMKAIRECKEHAAVLHALQDLRALMPVLHREKLTK